MGLSRRGITIVRDTLLGITLVLSTTEGCDSGWFGSSCQYMCHCRNGPSDCTDGECANGCDQKYFGDKCQYKTHKLLTHGEDSAIPSWLNDSDPETCNDGGQDYLRFDLSTASVIVSMVLTFETTLQREDSIEAYQIGPDTGGFIYCKPDEVHGNDLIMGCFAREIVQTVSITGPSVLHLCNVLITSGKNVALKAQANLMNRFGSVAGDASITVDGLQGCNDSILMTHDDWVVEFPSLMDVYLIVIFGRTPYSTESQFICTLKDADSNTVENKIIDWPVDSSVQYMSTKTIGIKSIRISVTGTISLCKVEVYGDDSECQTNCQLEQRRCAHTCKGGSDTCEAGSDICQNGCSLGFSGDTCRTTCPNGRYGNECSLECLPVCMESTPPCHHVSGDCLVCQQGFYGSQCEMTCSKNCRDELCYRENGHCVQGCNGNYKPPLCTDCKEGFKGPNCETGCSINCQVCQKGFYGSKCDKTCSKNCRDEDCDPENGHCLQGCNGNYRPPLCTDVGCDANTRQCESCKEGSSGQNCTAKASENDPGDSKKLMTAKLILLVVFLLLLVATLQILKEEYNKSQVQWSWDDEYLDLYPGAISHGSGEESGEGMTSSSKSWGTEEGSGSRSHGSSGSNADEEWEMHSTDV